MAFASTFWESSFSYLAYIHFLTFVMCRCSVSLTVPSLEYLDSRIEPTHFVGSDFVLFDLVSANESYHSSIQAFVSSRTLSSLFGATHAFVSSPQCLAVSLIFLIFFWWLVMLSEAVCPPDFPFFSIRVLAYFLFKLYPLLFVVFLSQELALMLHSQQLHCSLKLLAWDALHILRSHYQQSRLSIRFWTR